MKFWKLPLFVFCFLALISIHQFILDRIHIKCHEALGHHSSKNCTATLAGQSGDSELTLIRHKTNLFAVWVLMTEGQETEARWLTHWHQNKQTEEISRGIESTNSCQPSPRYMMGLAAVRRAEQKCEGTDRHAPFRWQTAQPWETCWTASKELRLIVLAAKSAGWKFVIPVLVIKYEGAPTDTRVIFASTRQEFDDVIECNKQSVNQLLITV